MTWILSKAQPRIEVWPIVVPDSPDEYNLKARVSLEGTHQAGLDATGDPWRVEVWLEDETPLIGRGSSAGYGDDDIDITADFEPLPAGSRVGRVLVRNKSVGEWSITLPAAEGEAGPTRS
ncbi:hypothetical protein [Kribbella sp. CA-293567]|uniref:hypothetical protein n=1 Tax=Kribbella sp. CA-293567 TaxID=3002436 RepID=UPI0022DD78D5|nr:hypothetical protein [Kribbella sp. CA-293567]WBQ02469.1 hypothetical protein OX958_21045 [Kribbella sp. CA-293567]